MRKKAKAARAKKAGPKAASAARAKPASAKPTADPANNRKRDPKTGEFRPGHRFWRSRASSGPEPLFADGDALWAACDTYFCWAEDNPIVEEQLVIYKGMTRLVPVPKIRPMTKRGLCRFLGIARTTWTEWKRDRPELAAAIERAESVVWDQKFAGAAVGIFNGNLVARELGIADKTEHSGELQLEDITPRPRDPDREAMRAALRRVREAAFNFQDRIDAERALPAADGKGNGSTEH